MSVFTNKFIICEYNRHSRSNKHACPAVKPMTVFLDSKVNLVYIYVANVWIHFAIWVSTRVL